MQRIEHLIDGKSVPGQNHFETINPATQDVLAEVNKIYKAKANDKSGKK